MKHKLLLVFVLSVFLGCGTPATSQTPPRNAPGPELVIGLTQFPSTFHPNIDSMLAKSYILAMVRRPFTVYDHNWKLMCMLCTKLPTLENGLAKLERTPEGGQGIAVTYTILPNAVWGDGKPITTKDVIFTWEVGRHKLSGVSNLELYRRVYKIDAIDDKTFTMHVDRVTFVYNDIGNFEILPHHVDAQKFHANPKEYKNRTAFDTDATNEGLFFGPYVITEIARGSHVVLKRNPKWWGKKPYFDRVVVRVIGNTAALEANLLSGGIDMISGELGLTVDQALAFQKRHGNAFNIIYHPGLIYEHIDLNLDNPILKDKRVRKALIHAIDRKAISTQLFAGRQPVAHSNVNPLDWVYDKTLPRYEYDPKKAAQLLAEAGWNRTRNGIRYNEKGQRLKLRLMTTAGNRTRELVSQVLQSQWRYIGIDARIRNEPARVFFGQTVTERKFPAMAMFAWISSPENVPRSQLHSAHIPSAGNNYSGQNYSGFADKEVDELIDHIEVELNADKRKQLWYRLQEIYVEELPVIPLYFRAEAYILPHRLKGLRPTGHTGPSTLWIEEWRTK
ncbi:MAG: peptide ABC transporter substrate-binding protein [Rhodospirillales bacterium]